MNLDFKNMETYHYFVIGGGGVAVLALVAYFATGGKMKVPTIITASVACLATGIAAGIMIMAAIGYNWNQKPNEGPPDPPDFVPGQLIGGGGPPGGKGKDAPPKGGGQGPKTQLVALVTKLNRLSEKPLSVSLDDAAKKKAIAEHIKDLGAMEYLTDEEATKRLEALHEAFKGDRETLEAAGYRWMTGKGGGKDGANPFKQADAEAARKALVDRVGK